MEEKACEKTAGCRRTEESTVWSEGAEGNEAERTTEKTAAGARRQPGLDHIFSPPHYLKEPSINGENKKDQQKHVGEGQSAARHPIAH